VVVGIAAAAFLMSGTRVGTHNPVASASWDRDVEPVVRERCFSCHRPGGSAGPVLASVEDFRTHRQAVKQAVIGRSMPPWSPVRGFGAFDRDRSLSPLQISLIASWIEAGAAGSRVSDGTILSDKLAGETPSSDRRLTLELPPFTPGQNMQRDVLKYPGTGTVAITGWRLIPGTASLGQVRLLDHAGQLLWTTPLDFTRENYPQGTGLILKAPFQLTVESLAKSNRDDARKQPFRSKPSHLEVYLSSKRIVELRMVRAQCGSVANVKGLVYGLRPDISSERSMDVRSAASAPRMLGLFRGPTNYSHTYWMRTPFKADSDSNLTVSGDNCAVEIILAPSRSRISS
jgi:hypothetical protein